MGPEHARTPCGPTRTEDFNTSPYKIPSHDSIRDQPNVGRAGHEKKDGCARTTESLALFSRGKQEAVT